MSDTTLRPDYRLRDFAPTDMPAFVETLNLSFPEEPTTVAEMEHWEQSYPEENPRLRRVAELADGRAIGFAACFNPFWMETPGAYWLEMVVHLNYRRHGIGSALLAAVEPFAWQQSAQRLWTNSREDHEHSTAFAEARGFHIYGKRFESALDLEAFDETPFIGAFDRISAGGYTLTTLAVERQLFEDADRRLYDLYDEIMVDVPFPGGAYPKTTYEQWRAWMLDSPTSEPQAMFLAKQGDKLVGLTILELPQTGSPFTSATGVQRAHRGHGLAMALKLHSFRYLRERGVDEVRAHNDTANPPILELNQRLGYKRLPGWLSWEKLNPASR